MTDKPAATPAKRGTEHERLNAPIGTWHAEGESYAVGQTKKVPLQPLGSCSPARPRSSAAPQHRKAHQDICAARVRQLFSACRIRETDPHHAETALAEEIELRRQIERVAERRRALPPGGAGAKDYQFEGETGPARFADLFGDKQTLAFYSYMYGPQRERPYPMCTSLLSAWDGGVLDVEQRIALVAVARSPITRFAAFKKKRRWDNLKIYSDMSGDYTRDYASAKDEDVPAFNVFTRRDGTIRHFWSGEMGAATADLGQDPRGAPDLMPLSTILGSTPEGRGTDWYPKLQYDRTESKNVGSQRCADRGLGRNRAAILAHHTEDLLVRPCCRCQPET